MGDKILWVVLQPVRSCSTSRVKARRGKVKSDFQRLNAKWTRFDIPCGQEILNLCNKKFCLPTLKSFEERCFIVRFIKQGLPADQPPENWRFSLHNLIRKSPNSRLGLNFHHTFHCSLFDSTQAS